MSDVIGNEHEGWLWTGHTEGQQIPTKGKTFTDALDEELEQGEKDAASWRKSFAEPFPKEVRTVDATTGAMKGRKDVELFTAPPYGLQEYGKVCSYGSNGKYAQNNWRLGFVWSLSANALLRHYLAWASGEDRDPESGYHHLAHAAWHCLVLVQYSQDHPEKDDRFNGPADPATKRTN